MKRSNNFEILSESEMFNIRGGDDHGVNDPYKVLDMVNENNYLAFEMIAERDGYGIPVPPPKQN